MLPPAHLDSRFGPSQDIRAMRAAIPDSAADPHSAVQLRFNGALNAVSASPDRDQVVVAGREVLKILSVTDSEVKETLNLRIGVNAKQNLNCSSNDVKWGGSFARYTIATAATNGAVVIWDLNRAGQQKMERVITEHSRAVNRICFNPAEASILLSASQDGTMKLWDLRAKNVARHTFEGKAESVRDVQFSPGNPFEFAAAFENGNIQKWDIRNPLQFERKWSAHNGLALTVDWHADSRLVASGGRDRQIKVWDMKSDSRKPVHTIQTMAPVARVSWRPGPGHEAQIASCALLNDFRIHVWDLGRVFVPLVAVDVHESVATDRLFVRTDMRGPATYRPINLLSTTALGWSIHGDLSFAIDERRRDEGASGWGSPGTATTPVAPAPAEID
ncbi:WD40-repeat-containing domain protein, partial [Blyttiomyces helicus]